MLKLRHQLINITTVRSIILQQIFYLLLHYYAWLGRSLPRMEVKLEDWAK